MSRRGRGEGTIYRHRDGLWIAQIRLPTGKRRTKYDRRRQVVQDWLTEQRKQVKDGLVVDESQLTYASFLDRYLDEVARTNCKAHTVIVYEQYIRLHIKPTLGHIKLSKLRPDQIQSLYHELGQKGLSGGSIRNIHRLIKHSLQVALRWGLVVRNVASLVDAPKYRQKSPQVWTLEQTRHFITVMADHPLFPLAFVAISTGLRIGEICGLTWSSVDFEHLTIQVRQSAQYVRGQGMILAEPKTERGRRLVTISPIVIETLKAHRERQVEWIERAEKWHEMDLVFPNRTGEPRDPSNLLFFWKKMVKEAGLPYIKFHALRHTHASLLLLSGMHPKIIQERLGHSSITLTLDLYSHSIPSLQQEAADKIEKLLLPNYCQSNEDAGPRA